MKHRHIISLLQKDYTTVGCEFAQSPGRIYTYKTNITLAKDDLVVVKVKDDYNICKVVRVDKKTQDRSGC